MNQEEKIANDITQLIKSLKPNASAAFQQNMKTFSKRVMISNLSNSSSIQSEKNLSQKIIDKVSETFGNKSALQCQQSIQNILSSNAIQKKAQILKMMLKTSQLIQKSSKSHSNIFKQSSVSTLNQTQQNTYSSNNNMSMAFIKQRKTIGQEQISIMRNRGSSQQGISELDILRQITYTLQNIEANFIVKDQDRDIYQLQNNINVSQAVKKIVSQLCDIGWLYKKITNSLSDKGSIEKSLFLAVQQQLNEYYRWLAIIQNMIKVNQLSLRKLILWSYEPMQKLKWLAIILETIRPYQGCQIISIINSYRPQGSQPINELLNRLLSHLVQPLLQFIHNWVYKGQLIDQNKQFFIEQKLKTNQILDWVQKFHLVQKNIPNILDKQSAFMIFNAGKTLYFLKNRCKCNYSLSISFINPNQILNKQICQSSNILSLQFKKWLKNVYQNLSNKLVNVLNDQFNLRHHLNSMKYFYLMGKGDFVQQLVDSLKDQLLKAKHQIYQHTLDGYISDAMTKSFIDFKLKKKQGQKMGNKIDSDYSFRAQIVDRLIAKKVDFGQNSWDSFNFQYSMDKIQPLYSVIKPAFITNYQKIFHFLWKVKRIEQALKQIWLSHLKQYPRKRNSKENIQGARILHRCHILHSNMTHFLNNFYGYLMIAIESAWDRFQEALNKAKSLDQIIKEHFALQNQILNITFNNNSSNQKNLLQSLNNIFKNIQSFKAFQHKIMSQYSAHFEKVRNYQNRKIITTKGLLKMQQQSLQNEYPQFGQEQLYNRMTQIQSLYNQTFKTFFDKLKNEKQDVSILIFRLDFSQFYAMQQIQQNIMV